MKKEIKFSDLLGQTLLDITVDVDRIVFSTVKGEQYLLWHNQDCCESVGVEDIDGDIQDLINSPITQAEESSNSDDAPKSQGEESWTWTYYKLATIKGYVTIRWYGSSNGYYSESVEFTTL